jgi:multidrug efflux pump subunit AcrA (membrane-fusion protein)
VLWTLFTQETMVIIAFNKKIWAPLVLIPAALVTAGCTKSSTSADVRRPPEVEVIAVEQKDIPVYREWIGTLDGMVNAAIRAQVTGYLLRQNYSEGSFVRNGQSLFEIDPRPFQAAVDRIGVAKAEYFPQISLSGFLGGQSTQLSSLFNGPHSAWSFVPQIS